MKKLLFLIIIYILFFATLNCQAQISQQLVYRMLEKDSSSSIVIRNESARITKAVLLDLTIRGDFDYPESDYDLSIYSGEAIEVLNLIDCDKEYFRDARAIYVYTGWNFMSECTVVLIYKL